MRASSTSPHSPLPLTAVVLSYNSERTLRPVLDSLQFCKDIVVVDSGSTDSSLIIANTFGNVRVFHRKLAGFGEQKNFAVEQAKFDWVFVVDSDEIVSKPLQDEIFAVFQEGAHRASAYQVPVQLYFLGKPIHYSGQQSKKTVRLFNRFISHFDQAVIHENVVVKGELGSFKHPLLHHSYLTLEDYFSKFNRYTSLAAKKLAEQSSTPQKHKVFTGFAFHFFKFYFIKLGMLDGYHGFLWCLFSSLYPVVKYAKYEEFFEGKGLLQFGIENKAAE